MPKTKASSPAKTKTSRAAKAKPSQEEIALRAYHIYLERNGAPGDPHADWLRAEADLIDKAIANVLQNGLRTGDIMSPGFKQVGTKEMGDAIIAEMEKLAK